ncbi:unnamed protein product [Cyprideis torosa]|uniref:Uncharacterized protein n=1 Tax=Cyprideis torosa TaxID=163714 RepID=A0A7R8ZP42_9CRUS|nr:unnamed protein product [Cyprideis torosa]CAG0899562.1 unnamed protein product [Cyprideis torosa]
MLFRGSHSRSLPYVGVNIFVVIFLCLPLLDLVPADFKKENLVEECRDFKDFKKILKTRKNVLVLFADSQKSGERLLGVCREVALAIKGSGSILYVNCANSDSKKLCKKIKVNPNPVELKHYKDGEFHKDYDRREDVKPMINFMRDPTGDIPWEEDSSAQDIEHVDSAQVSRKWCNS